MKILKEMTNALLITGQTAVGFAGKMKEQAIKHKNNYIIEQKMKEKLLELGSLVYEMSQTKENKNEEIRQVCKEIKMLENSLISQRDLQEEQKIQEEEKEKKQKKEIKAEDFPKEKGYTLLSFCPKCHIGNPPDAKECISCGFSFEK